MSGTHICVDGKILFSTGGGSGGSSPGSSSGLAETFETVSKNLKSWDATFAYTGRDLTSIIYTNGASTITKTLTYVTKQLTSIVLTGDTPAGINLTKTLTYTGKDLTDISYS